MLSKNFYTDDKTYESENQILTRMWIVRGPRVHHGMWRPVLHSTTLYNTHRHITCHSIESTLDTFAEYNTSVRLMEVWAYIFFTALAISCGIAFFNWTCRAPFYSEYTRLNIRTLNAVLLSVYLHCFLGFKVFFIAIKKI